MKIIAGIDIKGGKVVQLKGNHEHVVSESPVEFALNLKKCEAPVFVGSFQSISFRFPR